MDLICYPKYKSSKVSWLNMVPEHWEFHRGKFLFKKMSRPVRDEDEVVTCFRDGMVTLRKSRRIKGFTESLKEIGYQGIRKGDLVIHQMDAFAGAVGVSDSDGKSTPVYSVCSPIQNLNSKYYAYIVREMARSEYILSLAKGIRQRSTDFRFDSFGAQFLPVPPIQEQNQIINFLDWQTTKINKLIKNKKKLITLLKEQNQNFINEAITKGVDPHVQRKDSGVPWLGSVPVHWEIRKLKQVASFNPSKSESYKYLLNDEPIVFLPMEKISVGGNIDCTDKKKASDIWSGFTYFRRGDVVLAKITPCFENGKGAYLNELTTDIGFGTTELFVLRPGKAILGNFLRYLLNSKSFLRLGAQYMTGAAGQQRVQSSFIKNYELGLPSLKEQQFIVSYIEKEINLVNQIIMRAEQEIKLIQEYRTRLIADVVTGKLDVRNINIPNFEPIELIDELEDEEIEAEEIISEDME